MTTCEIALLCLAILGCVDAGNYLDNSVFARFVKEENNNICMGNGYTRAIHKSHNLTSKLVNLAVLAPADPHNSQGLPRILPAILLAVKYITSDQGPLPGWNVTVDSRDSKFASREGPLHAFDFYLNKTASMRFLFFILCNILFLGSNKI